MNLSYGMEFLKFYAFVNISLECGQPHVITTYFTVYVSWSLKSVQLFFHVQRHVHSAHMSSKRCRNSVWGPMFSSWFSSVSSFDTLWITVEGIWLSNCLSKYLEVVQEVRGSNMTAEPSNLSVGRKRLKCERESQREKKKCSLERRTHKRSANR